MGFVAWVKKHPAWSGAGAFLAWIGTVWPSWVKEQTIPEWVAGHLPGNAVVNYHTVSVTLNLAVCGLFVALIVVARRGDKGRSLQIGQAVAPSAPSISPDKLVTQSYNGESATIGVRNTDRPFKLLVTARVVACSRAVRRSAPYELLRRDLKTGDSVNLALAQIASSSVWTFNSQGIHEQWELNRFAGFDLSLTIVLEFAEVASEVSTITERTYVVTPNKDHTLLKVHQ